MENEAVIRLVAFLTIFGSMAAFELLSPRLERDELRGALKTRRWFANLSVLVVASVSARLLFPPAAVGTAIFAANHGWGLFNLLDSPFWVAAPVAFVILDFAVWFEHVVSHRWPLLWRLHRMHHSDQGFDLTTALRFHPLEIVLSLVWKAVIIVALGAPVLAVLVFEIVLNGMAMFNHANAKLPPRLDAMLRRIVVTPDMHRVHHSVERTETDSNFGFNLSIWDRMFGTYVAQPAAGHDAMEIGLPTYQGRMTSNPVWALVMPFARH